MLYQTKTKSENKERLNNVRTKFQSIYEDHGIDIVGFWENEEDSSEVFYMSRYESETDYKSKVAMLKEDQRYQELTAELGSIRETFSTTRLRPMTSK